MIAYLPKNNRIIRNFKSFIKINCFNFGYKIINLISGGNN